MIIRVKKKVTPFVVLDVTALRDKTLSLQAKGLHAYLMTLPDNWKIRLTELATHFSNGYSSFHSAFEELISAGYAKKVRTNSEGRGDWKVNVYETPQTDDKLFDEAKTEEATRLPEKQKAKKLEGITVTDLVLLMPSHLQDPVLWREWIAHRIAIRRPFTIPAGKILSSKLKDFSIGAVREAVHDSIMKGWTGVFPRTVDCPSSVATGTPATLSLGNPVEDKLVAMLRCKGTVGSKGAEYAAAQLIVQRWDRLPGSPNDPDTVKGHYGSVFKFCRSLLDGVPIHVLIFKTQNHMDNFIRKEEQKLGMSFKTGRGL